MADKKTQKKKGSNKHASNLRRHERKARNSKRLGPPTPGKCGSSFCTKETGCVPWK